MCPDIRSSPLVVSAFSGGRKATLLQPQPAEAGLLEPDLSLECWSLRSCADAVAEASGLALVVEGPEAAPLA